MPHAACWSPYRKVRRGAARADGGLNGFDVRDGTISIGGLGLSSQHAQVDLLARSISINADLWAKHLNTITGANQVNHENLHATAQAGKGAAPQFALDASALGSMFANAVRLVGTEKGVGFNLGGGITARAGDIVVKNNGNVHVLSGGRLQAEGSATMAGVNIDNAGTITTHGGIAATTPGQLTNSGTLAAGTDLLAQGDRIVNSGSMGAGVDANASVTDAGTTNLSARTSIQSNGTIVSGADTTATGTPSSMRTSPNITRPWQGSREISSMAGAARRSRRDSAMYPSAMHRARRACTARCFARPQGPRWMG